jgi:hypothetical protein
VLAVPAAINAAEAAANVAEFPLLVALDADVVAELLELVA